MNMRSGDFNSTTHLTFFIISITLLNESNCHFPLQNWGLPYKMGAIWNYINCIVDTSFVYEISPVLLIFEK